MTRRAASPPSKISAAEIADQRLIHLDFAFGGLSQVADHHVGEAIYGVIASGRSDLPPASRVIQAAARALARHWEDVPGYADPAEIAARIQAGYDMEHRLRHPDPEDVP